MIKNLLKMITTLSMALVVSSAVADGHKKYDGPKMDLSKFQPEFRIGFLGDEASQDLSLIHI